MMRNRTVLLVAALLAVSGSTATSLPAPTVASASQGQNRGVLPTQKVSKRQLGNTLLRLGSYGVTASGGTHPWVDKHGYLLRQVRR